MADEPDRASILVIGYGNDLRSDDGAGRWVADQIAAMDLLDVDVLSVMQLTPELAPDLTDRDLVVLVDAAVDITDLRIEELDAVPVGAPQLTHHGNPASVVALSSMVGNAPDRVVLASIPASSLGMGSTFSPATREAAHRAVDEITGLIAAR